MTTYEKTKRKREILRKRIDKYIRIRSSRSFMEMGNLNKIEEDQKRISKIKKVWEEINNLLTKSAAQEEPDYERIYQLQVHQIIDYKLINNLESILLTELVGTNLKNEVKIKMKILEVKFEEKNNEIKNLKEEIQKIKNKEFKTTC